MRKEEVNPSVKSNKRTQNTLSQVPNGIELIWRLGEDLIYWMCLRVESFALAMNVMFWKHGCQWMWWLGCIYSPNHFLAVGKGCWRWAHRTVRCATATVHCPVHATSAQPLGFWAVDRCRRLSSSCTGQSGTLWLLRSDFCCGTVHHCSSAQSTVGTQGVVAPLAHRTVRWIIAKRASEFLRVVCLEGGWPGALDTVRCDKLQHTQVFCSNFDWVSNWISFLVCVEPYATEINHI
jgi:hypothetical protein